MIVSGWLIKMIKYKAKRIYLFIFYSRASVKEELKTTLADIKDET